MQLIRISETTAGLIEVPFTTVSITNMQTRLNGATLPNTNLRCYIKQGGTGSAVLGTGTFTTVDDTNAPGMRGYKPAAGEIIAGIQTLRFYDTGGLMEPREVAVMGCYEDPYRPVYYGVVVAGTLLTTAVSTNRTETTANAFSNALVEFITGPNAGSVMPAGAFAGTGSVGTFTWKTGYTTPATPTAGDVFRVVTR